jgi:hypothetical protein
VTHQQFESRPEEEPNQRRLAQAVAGLLLALMALCLGIMLAFSQSGLRDHYTVDLRSKLSADYSGDNVFVFAPLRPDVVDVIAADRSIAVVPAELLPGPTVQPTAIPGQLPTSPTPPTGNGSATPTRRGTVGPGVTSTAPAAGPTQTLTPTRTPAPGLTPLPTATPPTGATAGPSPTSPSNPPPSATPPDSTPVVASPTPPNTATPSPTPEPPTPTITPQAYPGPTDEPTLTPTPPPYP